MIKRVRGTQDILPEDSYSWQEIEATARRIFSLYHYQEIRTPILEEASVFSRSLGETAEIVQKQMFYIRHKKDQLVLRPEGTASVVRAYLENNLDKKEPEAKFYYFGPMFRAERPQKGRLRQFHHLGIEAIGSLSAQLDVEVISLGAILLKELGISNYKIYLNSLGCSKDKLKFNKELQIRLKNKLSRLCSDCQARAKRNVLRILDCKKAVCKKIISDLELRQDYLCSDCRQHFKKVTDGLDSIGLRYELSHLLVRGLDYYTRTVFEIRHSQLGAQDALAAGGRYDNLVEQFGGASLGAIGFAMGIERLLLIRQRVIQRKQGRLVYIITLGEEADKRGAKLLNNLRVNNIFSDMDYTSRSLKGKMRQANELGAKYCVIIGEDEIEKGLVSLRDMESCQQRGITEKDLLEYLTHN